MTIMDIKFIISVAFVVFELSEETGSSNVEEFDNHHDNYNIAPPKYVVNLDTSPTARWDHIIRDFKKPLALAISAIMRVIPSILHPIVEKLAADIDNYLRQPYADEIRGIAKTGGFTVGEIVISNVLYDITTFCTSIITRDRRGMIWHTRNLDYGGSIVGNITKLLHDITVQVDFQRNGTAYTRYGDTDACRHTPDREIQQPAGVYPAWDITTLRSHKGVISSFRVDGGKKCTENTYTSHGPDGGGGGLLMNVLVAILDHKLQPMSFIIRETLESALTFREAVTHLANTVTMSDVYYIMGGQSGQEGVVITKGRLTYDNLWWLKPPPSRATAIKLIEKMGQNITTPALFDVISTPPVFNERTVYQVVMSAAVPDLMTVRLAQYHGSRAQNLQWRNVKV